MRGLLLLALILGTYGCDAPGPAPITAAEKKAAETKRRTEAKKQWSAAIDEASKGLQLLESHPDGETLTKEIAKIRGALQRAGEVYPTNPKFAELADEGRMMMRYFDACQNVAEYEAEKVKKNQLSPEKAQTFIDKTCDGNATAIRQLIDRIKAKQGQQ